MDEAFIAFRELTPEYDSFSIIGYDIPRTETSTLYFTPNANIVPTSSFKTRNLSCFAIMPFETAFASYGVLISTNNVKRMSETLIRNNGTVSYIDLNNIVPNNDMVIRCYLREFKKIN